MRLLLTWTDRTGFDAAPSHHRQRPANDRGPVLRLLDQPESRDAYDVAWVLTTPATALATEGLVSAMRTRLERVELRSLELYDPSDHEKLFHALTPLVRAIPEGAEVTTLLSAGTPQAQALWLVLVKSGLLRARMLQVLPPALVPDPHPHAIREVTLDIEGFPEIRALREEVVQLRARETARLGLIGASPALEAMLDRVARVAQAARASHAPNAGVPVLIHGETGSGKEAVARAIHAASPRALGPFLAERCGSLADGTLASELFGHERGAFTGAIARRRGLFELAHGGTLFLDEIGEVSPRVQVSLLRVLEEGVIRRVGGEEPVRVDVRVVAATHRDLARMVEEGTFREELYYRLKGAVIEVPPLRARASDLEALVAHFLQAHDAREPAAPGETLTAGPRPTRGALEAMRSYAWPGNVRELRAEVARWRVFCDERVDVDDLAPEIRKASAAPKVPAHAEAEAAPRLAIALDARPLAEAIAELEDAMIRAALDRTAGNLARAARELAIDRNTLKRKLRKRAAPPRARKPARKATKAKAGAKAKR
jgi:DNA-binding NtrC family response regulator